MKEIAEALAAAVVSVWLAVTADAYSKPTPTKRPPITVPQACLDAPLAPECMP
jgi:hypothetical protein